MSTTERSTEHLLKDYVARIGKDGSNYTEIQQGILEFRYGNRHLAFEGEFVANAKTASGTLQAQKDYYWELRLQGDCRRAFYTENIDGSGNKAIVDNADNNAIGYFVVTATVQLGDGSQTELTRTITLTNAVVDSRSLDSIRDGGQYTYRGRAQQISDADA